MAHDQLTSASGMQTPRLPSTLKTCPNGHPIAESDTLCPHCGTLTPTEPLPTGPSLPHIAGYEILGILGRGGMGVVYKARQKSLDRIVALKMIRDGGLAGAEAQTRFRAEAQAIARLQHPHIVQVFEVGEHEGQPFFSLELVSGGSLADQLNGTPQPPQQAARLIETLARAVHAAHQQGIVHRDLKPANVLLTSDGTPKVSDFGLAKRLDSSLQTRSGVILGTPAYMAPEQAGMGETPALQSGGVSSAVGPAADIYSLGAILYEMLTGRPPFLGLTALDTLQQVKSRDPVPPRHLQPRVPRDLETICLKCLQKEPRKRYESAEALAEDLRRFSAGEPIHARRAGPVERLAIWCRRRPAVTLLVILLLLTVTAGFVGITWKWREAEQRKQQAEQAEQEARQAEQRVRARSQIAVQALRELSEFGVAQMFGGHPAEGQSLQGLILRVGKRLQGKQARRVLERVCALGEQILEDDAVPDLILFLIEQYAFRSVFQLADGLQDDAVATCRLGLNLLDRLAAHEKKEFGDPKRVALNCFMFGAVLMILKRYEDAALAFQLAVDHQRGVLVQNPTDRKQRKDLSKYYFHLAHVQRQAGHLDESAATALERLKLWPNDADEVHDVACELALCASAIAPGKKDSKLSPDEQKRRRAFADQAMEVLSRAVKLGLKDAAAVRRGTDFKSLWDRDDFRKLVEEMANRERPSVERRP
jgi:tRNA A-37 threonylcarbamoyl transferase component Bud32/tetratricopeptide (TPR) repeat protein